MIEIVFVGGGTMCELAFSHGDRRGQFKINQETYIGLFVGELGGFCGFIRLRILTIIVSGADCVRLRYIAEHVDTSELFSLLAAAGNKVDKTWKRALKLKQ